MADTSIRDLIDELGPRVGAAWGPLVQYDLELRVALLPELAAIKTRVGAEEWAAALSELFAGPRPKGVAPALLAIFRRRARAVPVARVVETTSFVPTAPAAAPSRYHAALQRLLSDLPDAERRAIPVLR